MKLPIFQALAPLAALICGGAAAQTISRTEYIDRWATTAIAHAEKYGIPASVKMAQGILESGFGNGRLANAANSHFNIKARRDWTGAVVYHDDDAPSEAFRAYDSPEDSWLDHSEYLNTQPRYDSLFAFGPADYRSWARGLKNAGYATDPLYADKLVRIIEEHQLWRLDDGSYSGGYASGATLPTAPAAPATQGPTLIASTALVDPDNFSIVIKRK